MKKAFVFFGILLGLLFILLGTFNSQREENLTDDIVALVDNHPILRSDLDLALEALSMNKENPLTDEQIRLVRERLIDEQLLLQRGIDLNLHQTSNPIRKLIVNSMIDSILSENNDFLLEDSDLESFYNDNISFFLPAKQLRLKRIFIQFRSQEEDEEKLDREEVLAINECDKNFDEWNTKYYGVGRIVYLIIKFGSHKFFSMPFTHFFGYQHFTMRTQDYYHSW